jgi:hypothetical protein
VRSEGTSDQEASYGPGARGTAQASPPGRLVTVQAPATGDRPARSQRRMAAEAANMLQHAGYAVRNREAGRRSGES